MSAQIVVVGGGVIGLSVAYALARRGRGPRVLLLERGQTGQASSWAGAGMIAPVAPDALTSGATPREGLAMLRALSSCLYETWARDLRDETGIDPEYRRQGGVDLAFNTKEADELQAMSGRWKREGIVFERLAQADYHRVEPRLNDQVQAVYFLPDRAQIRNPRLLRALRIACQQRGVTIETGCEVANVVEQGGRVRGVRLEDGTERPGEIVVLAAGAWTGGLLERLGRAIPTRPVKGQLALLAGPPGWLRRIVEHGSYYLVPRADGRILAGATIEPDAGFDSSPTEEGVREVLEEAFLMCPGLRAFPVERTWAGLRPGSPDSRPLIGPLPGIQGLIVAAGHKRAGLQQAPGTGEVVADLIEGVEPRVPLEWCRPDRDPVPDEEVPSVRS
ncbi:glycine oxidase ThiO [Isosphaera pallida]|uniref:glycine oxidase ThiO n=1 Tax=Isosphaera pallida TaxID=128 RepID=UPI000319F0C0|nr:glycine oxidase ThiO [Isosphaera pallida]